MQSRINKTYQIPYPADLLLKLKEDKNIAPQELYAMGNLYERPSPDKLITRTDYFDQAILKNSENEDAKTLIKLFLARPHLEEQVLESLVNSDKEFDIKWFIKRMDKEYQENPNTYSQKDIANITSLLNKYTTISQSVLKKDQNNDWKMKHFAQEMAEAKIHLAHMNPTEIIPTLNFLVDNYEEISHIRETVEEIPVLAKKLDNAQYQKLFTNILGLVKDSKDNSDVNENAFMFLVNEVFSVEDKDRLPNALRAQVWEKAKQFSRSGIEVPLFVYFWEKNPNSKELEEVLMHAYQDTVFVAEYKPHSANEVLESYLKILSIVQGNATEPLSPEKQNLADITFQNIQNMYQKYRSSNIEFSISARSHHLEKLGQFSSLNIEKYKEIFRYLLPEDEKIEDELNHYRIENLVSIIKTNESLLDFVRPTIKKFYANIAQKPDPYYANYFFKASMELIKISPQDAYMAYSAIKDLKIPQHNINDLKELVAIASPFVFEQKEETEGLKELVDSMASKLNATQKQELAENILTAGRRSPNIIPQLLQSVLDNENLRNNSEITTNLSRAMVDNITPELFASYKQLTESNNMWDRERFYRLNIYGDYKKIIQKCPELLNEIGADSENRDEPFYHKLAQKEFDFAQKLMEISLKSMEHEQDPEKFNLKLNKFYDVLPKKNSNLYKDNAEKIDQLHTKALLLTNPNFTEANKTLDARLDSREYPITFEDARATNKYLEMQLKKGYLANSARYQEVISCLDKGAINNKTFDLVRESSIKQSEVEYYIESPKFLMEAAKKKNSNLNLMDVVLKSRNLNLSKKEYLTFYESLINEDPKKERSLLEKIAQYRQLRTDPYGIIQDIKSEDSVIKRRFVEPLSKSINDSYDQLVDISPSEIDVKALNRQLKSQEFGNVDSLTQTEYVDRLKLLSSFTTNFLNASIDRNSVVKDYLQNELVSKLGAIQDPDTVLEILEDRLNNSTANYYDVDLILKVSETHPSVLRKLEPTIISQIKNASKDERYVLEAKVVEATLGNNDIRGKYAKKVMSQLFEKDIYNQLLDNEDIFASVRNKGMLIKLLNTGNDTIPQGDMQAIADFAERYETARIEGLKQNKPHVRTLAFKIAELGISEPWHASKIFKYAQKTRMDIKQLATITAVNMPEWMYPVVARAAKEGVIDVTRLGSVPNLFDASKAWMFSSHFRKKDAISIGKTSFNERMIAGNIMNSIYNNATEEEQKDKKLLSERFWDELQIARSMPEKMAMQKYLDNTKANRKKILHGQGQTRLSETEFNHIIDNTEISSLLNFKEGQYQKAVNVLYDLEWQAKGYKGNISTELRKKQKQAKELGDEAQVDWSYPASTTETVDLMRFRSENNSWIEGSALGLSIIFGKAFPDYLRKTKDYVSTHDAAYWLPTDLTSDKVESFRDFLHRHVIYDTRYGEKRMRDISELSVIAANWPSLEKEDEKKSYKDILALTRSKKYVGQKSGDFAEEAAKFGINQSEYHKFENIYLTSQKVPAPFNTDLVFKSGKLTGRFLPRSDVRVGFFGHYTGCCQHWKGVGKACAISSVKDPFSQLFAIETKDGEIFAGSWVWENIVPSENNKGEKANYKFAVFDNIESKKSYAVREEIHDIYAKVGEYLKTQNYRQVLIGTGLSDVSLDRYELTNTPIPLPKGYSGYSDSKSQKVLVDNPEATAADKKMEQVYITGASQDDFYAFEKVAQICFPEGSQNIDLPSDNPQAYALKDIDKGVVGYVVFSDEEKYISDMAVLPEYRTDLNRSSQKLLDTMMDHMQEEGGVWSADLRDQTSLVYMYLQAKRGVVKIASFDNYEEYTMSNGDKVFSTDFEVVPFEKRAETAKANEKILKEIAKHLPNRKKDRDNKSTSSGIMDRVVEHITDQRT